MWNSGTMTLSKYFGILENSGGQRTGAWSHLGECLHWPPVSIVFLSPKLSHQNKSWQMFNVFIFSKCSNVYIGHYCVPLTFSTLMLSDIRFTNVQLFQWSNVQTLIHLTMLISQWQQGWAWRSEYWNCRNKSAPVVTVFALVFALPFAHVLSCICIFISISICICISSWQKVKAGKNVLLLFFCFHPGKKPEDKLPSPSN